MTDFTTVYSNNLPDVQMIAGDVRTFNYSVYDETGNPIALNTATAKVIIFKYGDPSFIFWNISGSIILDGINNNRFTITFSGYNPSANGNSSLSGTFQQQVIIQDTDGFHIPAQGKIIIFPSNIGVVVT